MFWRRKRKAREQTPTVAADDRIYAIGDIHGRADLLDPLLETIQAHLEQQQDARKPKLIILGDVVDRGDATRAVLSRLAELLDEDWIETQLLMGNHEKALLDFLEEPERGRSWLSLGGQQTLGSYGISVPVRRLELLDLRRIHAEFADAFRPDLDLLRSMSTSAQSGDVFFSHAGVNPSRKLADQSDNALLWGHPEFLAEMPVPGMRIVHGHFDHPEPVVTPGRICVDTGAYYTGRLTCACLDDNETFLSSQIV